MPDKKLYTNGKSYYFNDLYPAHQARLINFLVDLNDLCDRYEFDIGGCGCCGSPWVEDRRNEIPCMNYLIHDEEGYTVA